MGEPVSLDMDNRDPNNINDYLQVGFDDIIAEPEDVRSINFCWGCSYACFNGGKNCCYKFLTFLCAPILALCWGCSFACLAFNHIWYCIPYYKYCQIECRLMRKFWFLCIDCFCSPCCEAWGMCLSKIHITKD